MDYEKFLELAKQRRSIRRFKAEPIPDESVDKIIEAARLAPSGFNTQPWEFVVIRKKELKEGIIEIVRDYTRANLRKIEPMRESWQKDPFQIKGGPMDWRIAPVFILLMGDTRTTAGLPMTVRFQKETCQSIFTSSLACAFIYMQMAATALALASQWFTFVQFPIVQPQIRALLGIPEEMELYDMLVVGKGALKARPKLLRDKEKMVHYDTSDKEDFRTDEEVRDFIKKSRAWTLGTINR
ncbi:nitroreductase family protein, partial [Thermodesulfobacteriota bacterium]